MRIIFITNYLDFGLKQQKINYLNAKLVIQNEEKMFENLLSTVSTTARVWIQWTIKASIVIVILVVANILTKFISRLMRKHMKGHIEPTVLELTELITKAVVYIAALLIILNSLGIEGILVPMLTSAGIIGIVLGFALRDSLSNVFAGISLFMDEPFKIGDIIKIGDLNGRLYDIGLRSTQIKTFDNNLIVLPNNYVAASNIINYTKKDPKIRVKTEVDISYESDIDKAIKILTDIAKKDKNVMNDPAPDVRVDDLGESGITLQLRTWVPGGQFVRKTPSDMRYNIKKEFDKRGIEIPYPRRYIIDGRKARRKK
jgi:small-conductance mechanosensitive channel